MRTLFQRQILQLFRRLWKVFQLQCLHFRANHNDRQFLFHDFQELLRRRASSTIRIAPYLLVFSTICGSGARSPSIEKHHRFITSFSCSIGFSLLKLSLKIIHIPPVLPDISHRFCQPDSVNNACMVEFIGENRILFRNDRRNDGLVCIEARLND